MVLSMNDIYPLFNTDIDVIRNQRKILLSRCFGQAISACDAYQAVRRNLFCRGNILYTTNASFELLEKERIHICALGKAAIPMARGVVDAIGDKLLGGVVVTKAVNKKGIFDARLTVMVGDHPLPGDLSLQAGKTLIAYSKTVKDPDIIIYLISGGGSSLAVLPAENITLDDLRLLNDILLRTRVGIEDVNIIRKHLDQIKNGGLLAASETTRSITLILSDVMNGGGCAVASGPTVADASTFSDCLRILRDTRIIYTIPDRILAYLEAGKKGEELTTGSGTINQTSHPFSVIGDNHLALKEIAEFAKENGYSAFISQGPLNGQLEIEAERILQEFEEMVLEMNHEPFMMIWGGEVTVERKGNEIGGRNAHLSLHLARKIACKTGVYGAAFATDGEDGTSLAAGAYFDHSTVARAISFGISIEEAIHHFASYRFFSLLGDIASCGSTGTNVNDIVIMMKESDQ